jgi:hypothetical protein
MTDRTINYCLRNFADFFLLYELVLSYLQVRGASGIQHQEQCSGLHEFFSYVFSCVSYVFSCVADPGERVLDLDLSHIISGLDSKGLMVVLAYVLILGLVLTIALVVHAKGSDGDDATDLMVVAQLLTAGQIV